MRLLDKMSKLKIGVVWNKERMTIKEFINYVHKHGVSDDTEILAENSCGDAVPILTTFRIGCNNKIENVIIEPTIEFEEEDDEDVIFD